ncbi:MAG: type II CAAX prenyl endopeptidase Rce1 family protein, partial [Huintestinicola sp.]
PLVRLAPIIYIIKKLKMPIKLIAPVKISNKPLFFESIPMAMLIYGIGMVFSGLSSFIVDLFGFQSDFSIWIPNSKSALVLSTILYAFIIPIISEVIHRGLFMQILRQFGDGYALLLTSMIAALTTSGGKYMFTFVYSIVIGYFAMRTGSILTAVAMRLVISNASYWLTYLKQTMPDNDRYLTISFIIAALFLLVGVSSIIVFSKKHSNKINLPIYAMYMSQRDKLICAVTNPRVIIWIALALLTAAASAALL